MTDGGSASPDDPDWVDQILSRAMEQAEATDPAPVAPGTPAVPPVQPAAQSPATAAPSAQTPPASPPVEPSVQAAQPGAPAQPAQLPRDTDPTPPGIPVVEVNPEPATNDDRMVDVGPGAMPMEPSGPDTNPGLAPVDPPAAAEDQGDLGDWDDFDPAASLAIPNDNDGEYDPDAPLDPSQLLLDEEGAESGSPLRGILEWGAVILGALTVALLIKTFLMQAYFIPSSSMVPTLNKGDRILVNKVSYKLHDVNRGDLVVFNRPPTQPNGEDDLIKRVIGLGGETIRIENNEIFIDNRKLTEGYLPEGTRTDTRFLNTDNCDDHGANFCVIKEDHVFVMGDNRLQSQDSRSFGPVSEDLIVGRAFLRVWPPREIGAL